MRRTAKTELFQETVGLNFDSAALGLQMKLLIQKERVATSGSAALVVNARRVIQLSANASGVYVAVDAEFCAAEDSSNRR